MFDAGTSSDASGRNSRQIRDLLQLLEELVLDGLQHGFFGYAIDGVIGPGGRRDVVIRAGKSHKFTIPEDDLPR